jgi:hypothetical protein
LQNLKKKKLNFIRTKKNAKEIIKEEKGITSGNSNMVAARILKMVARLIHGERKRHREREREAV